MTNRLETRHADPGADPRAEFVRVQSLIDLEQAKADRDQGFLDRDQARGDLALSRVGRERRSDAGLHAELFDLEEGACHRNQEMQDAEQAAQDFLQAAIDRAQGDLDDADGCRSQSRVLRGFTLKARTDARTAREEARDARRERRLLFRAD